MPPTAEQQLQEMAARLKAFGVIMRIGHDLFNAKDFQTAAVMAVNNARPVVGFSSSTLLWKQDRRSDIISQYAQTALNTHTRLAVLQRDLLELAGDITEIVEINASKADEYGDGSVVRELCPDQTTILLVPLKAPPFLKKPDFQLIWLLEFTDKVPSYAMTAAKLLAAGYAEALYCQRIGGSALRAFARRSKFSFKLVFWLLVILVITFLMLPPFPYIEKYQPKVPERVTTEFELIAPEIKTVYAPFDGPIAKCCRADGVTLWKNGDFVRKGDIIAVYDEEQLDYRLKAAEAAVSEIQAELDLKLRDFDKTESRGEVKLLKAKLKSAQVAVEEAKWYKNQIQLTAPIDGILQLAEPRAENLIGKAVRTGDKLFDILSDMRPNGKRGLDVKVPVNERDSSILLKKPDSIVLFLHTSPDTPIYAKVREISPAPELTEQRTYCYNMLAELAEADVRDLKYGMRGIARIEGERVTIGYFLFKSVILYLRGL